MQIIIGVIFHFIGGFASGSFYVPFKKIKGWAWESYWIIGGIFSWLIVPPLAAWITVPDFSEIISQTPSSIIGWTYFWGVLWGIGGLTYGLGMRYLGMSLGNSVLLGFTSVFGSLAPSIYYDIVPAPGKTTFTELITTSWGRIVLAGIVICLAGIYICGRAGALKEKELPEERKKESIKEFNLVKGLIVCTVSGILSACFNYGIEAGTPMAEAANNLWRAAHPQETTEFLYQNNVIYIILLWGGLTTNFIWCMILNIRNRTFGNYINKKTPLARNYFFAALAGTVWFLQFFFYGMGESKLGNGASSWILHMAFIILVANLWGIALKEWKGVSKKTKTTIAIGILAIFLSVVLVGFGNGIKAQAHVQVTELQVELLKNPVGVDAKQPQLSWRLVSKDRNVLQSAYEIRVGKDAADLLQNKRLVWRVGKKSSDESLHIVYSGDSLQSGQKYYWQVRVWDNKGNVSEWSNVSFWQMGLLSSGDWAGKWVGLDADYINPADDHRRLAARMVRREFEMVKPIASATVFLSGLGFSELYLNGEKVDNRIMDPTHSNYQKRVMYVVFDVTKFLRRGRNAIGVILGNGRFFSPRVRIPTKTPTFGFPKMLMQMQVQYSDGTSEFIISDENWRITDQGPIRANSEFDGEEYDANMEQEGWDRVGFDDSAWQPAQLVSAPGGKLIAQMQEPMRVIERLQPVSIHHSKRGIYSVDFGQNLYGMCQIKVRGPKGTKVVLRTAFDIDSTGSINMAPNRSALSTDIYTLKGKGTEIWAPRFRGQGTRYAEITGWPGALKKEDIEFLVVHSDLAKVGEFSCSDSLVNKIYANMLRSVRMQERGLPMDPDRDERQAWLSVSEKTSETEGYMYNVSAFYNNFLNETRSSQREDGCLSEAGSLWAWNTKDPCWPAVITTTPWSCYYMYGDKRVLSENYPAMKRWVLYLEKNIDSDFIYRKGTYSDWVDAYSMDKKTSDNGGTSRELLSTAYMYYNYKTVEKTADFLGKPEDAVYFREAAKKVEAAFTKTFFDSGRSVYLSETQTSYVLPLTFGLVPPKYRQSVIDNLINDILVKHDGHLTVGCPGLKWLMQMLTSTKHTDVAYTILTQTTRPSWGYMVSKGGTSIWERWDRDTRDPGMNGQSQTILAGYLGAWMYQTLGGISYDTTRPGFKNIIMRPEPVRDIKWVNASFKSLYGLIISDWKRENGWFRWKVAVPPNTTATVHIPTNDAASVKEQGRPMDRISNIKFIGMEEGAAVYEIGSGSYEFLSSFNL